MKDESLIWCPMPDPKFLTARLARWVVAQYCHEYDPKWLGADSGYFPVECK